ncbi:MAG: phosphomannomutase/phosphoglucomutase [Candidatus Portnoybacteria bacterium]|nr:phosphomannomutase/phosphoglucomutase [Candidatus Portnoybacteria bacterium]
MQINPQIFRGYDIRGLVDKDLNEEVVLGLAKAYGTYIKRRGIKKAIVSRDCRQTSPAYAQKIIEGLNWVGIDTIDIGMNLVGTFYWSQYFLDCQGGIYVSASHNPAKYNGFKIAIGFSETFVSEQLQELRRMMEKDDFEKGDAPGKNEERNIRPDYFADILKRLPLKNKFKVVVDPGNSTAGEIAPDLFRQAGCEVVESNCQIDPIFPIGTPDPTESAVALRLREEVLAEGADVGFSYDADGDRIGIVDDKGTIIWNDVLVALFASDVLASHPGAKIMFNTLCSKVVPETILAHGGVPFMWRTGHSFLKKKNQEVGAAFIGELSGHFFFSADFYNHDDGLYSALRLLSFLDKSGKKLSDALAVLPKYISSPEIKLFCAEDKKAALMAKAAPILKKDFPEAEIIDDERAGDGLRLELADSMFVVRYSQNGPYITVKFESKTQERYDFLRGYIANLLHGFEEVDWNSDINVNAGALD